MEYDRQFPSRHDPHSVGWTVPREWAGETAICLGCGPSLRDVDMTLLRGAGHIIAINDAFMLCPWAEVLYFCDVRWWKDNEPHVRYRFTGRRIITLANEINGVYRLRNSGPDGLDRDPGALRHGSNSGYQAIHLAYHFGATRILLLGYDMQIRNAEMHWRERKDGQQMRTFERALRTQMLPKFPSLASALAREGVEVINCTPGSVLDVWPRRPLTEMIQYGAR